MRRKFRKAARQEIVSAARARYGQAKKPYQHRILDEFVAVTGYHRKHAIPLLTTDSADSQAAHQVERQALSRQTEESSVESALAWFG